MRLMRIARDAHSDRLRLKIRELEREAQQLRDVVEEYAAHASWRCEHPDRYPWEPDCPCRLTKELRELGIETVPPAQAVVP